MTKKTLFIILTALFLILINLINVNFALAQNNIEDIETCFKYYDYAKVKVNLNPDKSKYSPNRIVNLSGTIVNSNTFPITDVVLYAHIKRVNQDTQSFLNNGNYLIDRITLKKDINLMPNETKHIKTQILVKKNYPNGSYIVQYYIFSKQGFHYSGRPFLEEDTAGNSFFSIINSQDPDIYFDLANFKVNGKAQNIIEFSNSSNETSYNFEVPIIDKRANKTDLDVKITFFYFEDAFDDLIQKTENIKIKANNPILKTKLSLTSTVSGAYVLLAEINSPVKSVLKYRFIKNGSIASYLRMNDLGITDFPALKTSRAYVCFHSPANSNAPNTKIELITYDKNKKKIQDKSVEDSFPPEVWAISLPLSNIPTKNDFYIKAIFTSSRGRREIIKHYHNGLFADSLKDIIISYSKNRPNILTIKLINTSGNEIKNGGYIESLRILDSKDKVVQEKYALTTKDLPLNLTSLSAGKYTVKVLSGKIQKEKKFTISQDIKEIPKEVDDDKDTIKDTTETDQKQKDKSKKSSEITMLIIVIIVLTIVTVSFIIYQKKKGKKTNEK